MRLSGWNGACLTYLLSVRAHGGCLVPSEDGRVMILGLVDELLMGIELGIGRHRRAISAKA